MTGVQTCALPICSQSPKGFPPGPEPAPSSHGLLQKDQRRSPASPERRIFPAVDIIKSGTRREDLLLNREEQEAVEVMRRAINGMKADEAVENILNLFVRTNSNREFCQMVKKTKLI